jgi:hypothetical protein
MIPAPHSCRVRLQVLREIEQQSQRLAHHRADVAMIGTSPHDDLRNLACATAALRAYCARASLEELESALARIDDGPYGTGAP